MHCRICENRLSRKPLVAREMMYGLRDPHEYSECPACGCLQILRYPPDMERYYGRNYYAYGACRTPRKSGIKDLLVNRRNEYAVFGRGVLGRFLFRALPTDLFDFLGPIRSILSKRLRILDVGCGSGHRLSSLHKIGFNCLLGIDPYLLSETSHGRGLSIRKQTLGEVEGEYDLVMFHHSFEHVPDPLQALNKTCGLLAENGIGVIRVPTVSSYAWQHYGLDWVQLDAPRHFFLHSVESLETAAKAAGLVVFQTVYDSTAFQFWGSEQYRNDIPLCGERSYAVDPKASPFKTRDIRTFARRAKRLNAQKQGDQAAFYLKRADGRRESAPG